MAKQYKGPVRIKDIADRAGVSTGTVDRVIHGRGRVSSENERKVKEAIASLDYEPNLVARSLARNTSFIIGIVIPKYSRDSFWQSQVKGIERALLNIKDFGFELRILEFDDQIHGDMLKHIETIQKEKFDGMLVAPLITDDANALLDCCNEENIPYMLVNTNLEREDDLLIGYVGQNSFQSGTLAAKLLSLLTAGIGTLAIFHMEMEVDNSEHIQQKEKGFISFFSKKNQQEVIVSKMPIFAEDRKLIDSVKNFLHAHPKTSGIFVSTSRIHYLSKILKQLKREDIAIVGFDLIQENVTAIESYEKMFLINQNPVLQGYSGVMSLFDYLLKSKSSKRKQYLPLDVITKENLSAYIDSNSIILEHYK